MAGINLRTLFQDMTAPSEEEAAALREQEANRIFGNAAQPEVTAPFQQTGAEMFPGEQPIQGLMDVTQEAQAGTGLFQDLDQSQVPMMRAAKAMAGSANPDIQQQGFDVLGDMQGAQGGADAPSNVREWKYFNNLSAPDQQRFMDMKRGNSKIVNINGVPTRVPMNYIEGSGVEATPLTTLDEEIEAQTEITGAKEAAKVKQKGRVARLDEQVNNALVAADGMAVLNRGLTLLNSGIETGGWDNLALYAKQKFGIEGADEGELSNLMGKAVLAQLRETFGAAFTAKEGDSLKVIEAGFGKSPRANARLLQNALNIATRAAERGKSAARELKDDFALKQIEQAMSFELTGGDAGILPEGVTEEDIAETMRLRSMTRQQVLDRLNAR